MTDVCPEVLPDRRYLPWYRRWLPRRRTVALILGLILALPFGIRWYRLSLLPDVPIPFDAEAFCEVPALDEDNAYFYFGKAVALYQPVIVPPEMEELWEQGLTWPDVPEAVQARVIQQRPALDLYRRGGRCRESCFLPPQSYSAGTMLTMPQALRELQRVSRWEFLRLMHAGDHRGAAELLHDVFRASRLLGRRGCLMERFIGRAGHSHLLPGWQQWSRHADVTADEIETALKRLREDWRLTPPYSDALKVDYFMYLNDAKPPLVELRYLFDVSMDDLATKRLSTSARPVLAPLNANFPGWQRPILWVMGEPELTSRGGRLFVTHELKTCDLPFTEQPDRFSDGLHMHEGTDLIAGLSPAQLNRRLERTFLSSYSVDGPFQQQLRGEAGCQTMLEAEMELQIRYRREDISSSGEAQTLLANFPWPVDPCSAEGKPIQFRLAEDGLVIWSAGCDGIDQGGTSGENPSQNDLIVTIPWPAAKPDVREGE